MDWCEWKCSTVNSFDAIKRPRFDAAYARHRNGTGKRDFWEARNGIVWEMTKPSSSKTIVSVLYNISGACCDLYVWMKLIAEPSNTNNSQKREPTNQLETYACGQLAMFCRGDKTYIHFFAILFFPLAIFLVQLVVLAQKYCSLFIWNCSKECS